MTNPLFFDIVDTASKTVTEQLPQCVQNEQVPLNMVYGYSAGYGATRIAAWALSKLINPKLLPLYAKAESAASKILPFAALGYAIIDPDGAKQLMQIHPVYTAGMVSSTLGVSTALSHDSKRIKKNLEELTNVNEYTF